MAILSSYTVAEIATGTVLYTCIMILLCEFYLSGVASYMHVAI